MHQEHIPSAGKRVQACHDCVWFYFWLVEKVARTFFSQSQSVAGAIPKQSYSQQRGRTKRVLQNHNLHEHWNQEHGVFRQISRVTVNQGDHRSTRWNRNRIVKKKKRLAWFILDNWSLRCCLLSSCFQLFLAPLEPDKTLKKDLSGVGFNMLVATATDFKKFEPPGTA